MHTTVNLHYHLTEIRIVSETHLAVCECISRGLTEERSLTLDVRGIVLCARIPDQIKREAGWMPALLPLLESALGCRCDMTHTPATRPSHHVQTVPFLNHEPKQILLSFNCGVKNAATEMGSDEHTMCHPHHYCRTLSFSHGNWHPFAVRHHFLRLASENHKPTLFL